MLLCAAGLCPQNRGKPWAATSFAGLTLSLRYHICEKLLCPGPLHPQHCWGPVFPGFFPKLFCGRSTTNIFQEKVTMVFNTTTIFDLPNTCDGNKP